MKNLKVPILAAIIIVSLAPMNSAVADIKLGFSTYSTDVNYRHPNNFLPAHYGHYKRHRGHNSKQSGRHHLKHGVQHHYKSYRNRTYRKPYRRNYRQNDYRRYYRALRKSCHPVYKLVYDGYGNPYKIGGTMCYNRRGQGYVVDGSRYRIW